MYCQGGVYFTSSQIIFSMCPIPKYNNKRNNRSKTIDIQFQSAILISVPKLSNTISPIYKINNKKVNKYYQNT